MLANKSEYSISTAASILDLHPRTLRNYEKAGLVKPDRKRLWRYYSKEDIAWIECLVTIIHDKGINISSINRLLEFAPCWEIAECSADKRAHCPVCRKKRSVTKRNKEN